MRLLHADARLVDAVTGEVLGGSALTARVSAAAEAYRRYRPGVVFARIPVEVPAVVRYLGAWQAQRPIALLDPQLAAGTLSDLVARYEPAVVTGLAGPPAVAEPDGVPKGYRAVEDELLGPVWERESTPDVLPHPDLGLLLATSGSTGSPKLVRLSRHAIESNTSAIVRALRIGPEAVAVSSLPFFYSYGMSVLNSHLSIGAAVLLESGGLLHRPFWTAVAEHGVTSLAGVPYQYEMLRRLRFDPAAYPALRTLTQAGGRLRTELVADFNERMHAVGGRMFVMYGQTEAGPRITTLPAERLVEKLGSVGPVIPGGRLSVRLDDGTETTRPGAIGEVLYRGPNVMMGYAETAADLERGDELGGLLVTGDIGHLDPEAYLYLSGRSKRIGKVFGVRLNLDDVEEMLRGRGPVAAVDAGDRLRVWAEGADGATREAIGKELAERLKLHPSGFDVRAIDALPLLGNGKVDYKALDRLA